jgi:hypothetical protein
MQKQRWMQRQIPPGRAFSHTPPTLAPNLTAFSVTCKIRKWKPPPRLMGGWPTFNVIRCLHHFHGECPILALLQEPALSLSKGWAAMQALAGAAPGVQLGRSPRNKSSNQMAFPHPKPRKEQQRKKEIPDAEGVVVSIRRRIINVTEYRNPTDDVNPAKNRTCDASVHDV